MIIATPEVKNPTQNSLYGTFTGFYSFTFSHQKKEWQNGCTCAVPALAYPYPLSPRLAFFYLRSYKEDPVTQTNRHGIHEGLMQRDGTNGKSTYIERRDRLSCLVKNLLPLNSRATYS